MAGENELLRTILKLERPRLVRRSSMNFGYMIDIMA